MRLLNECFEHDLGLAAGVGLSQFNLFSVACGVTSVCIKACGETLEVSMQWLTNMCRCDNKAD